MAEIRLTPEKVSRAGLTATYNGSLSVANTYLVKAAHNIMLHFKKSAAVNCVVTFVTQNTMDPGRRINYQFDKPVMLKDSFFSLSVFCPCFIRGSQS